jgi:ABC-type polysaccharide/polyol phosphate transport system ATPase subunit/SAM-dependent methyltransferase
MSLLIESDIRAAGASPHEEAEVIVRLEGVSVEYRVPRERIRSFKEYAIRLLQGRVRHDEFKALREVDLEVRRGEFFGIVGHNGAGKSTLLKVVSRVMRPTGGRVWVKGRVAPLLELGAGFHPELSGRENVFLNGTLLGFTHAEMESLFDEIVDFAEMWDFIDAPLRTYSTGMAVRLGFAVATATRPDILIVDEVLAVGDEQFQEKCGARMNGFRQNGTAILLVTHDSDLVVESCDRAAWIDHGRLRAVGDPLMVVDQYHETYRSVTPEQVREGEAQETRARFADRSVTEAMTEPATEPAGEPDTLEGEVRRKSWFYRFELPGGEHTPCYLPVEIARYHDDRLAMLHAALAPIYGRDWSEVSCLDIGCNQGFFSVKMAENGCRQVLGVDARARNIEDAKLIHRLYDLPNLGFSVANLYELKPEQLGQFDVVLMLSLVFSLEDPINAIRIARSLTKSALIIETPVAPEVSGQIDWGTYRSHKPLQGSFALIDQSEEIDSPLCSLSGISLCPGRESLIWLMKRLGFSRVEVLPPPEDAYEQLAAGKRIMVIGYV